MQPTNNPVTTQTVQNPITPPVLPPMQNTSKSHKMIVWIVAGLVLIILAAGAIYLYLNNKKSTQPVEVTQQPTIAPAATPTPQSQDSLEKDLNAIDAEASASGLDSVDSDLKGL